MRTVSAKAHELDRKWYVVDVEGQSLGRAASRIASVLRGKHRADFTPHWQVSGDGKMMTPLPELTRE